MPVDETSLQRIRNATFPIERRGYDKAEVEKFLARLADWLDTGGTEETRSDAVKRELEKVGQRTGAILAQAEESAQQIREEAELEAKQLVEEATANATRSTTEADSYAESTRSDADAYAENLRSQAETEAVELRREAEQKLEQATAQAEAKAAQILQDGEARRNEIEAGIADLVRRRDAVTDQIKQLSRELDRVVSEHHSAPGSDPLAETGEMDPAAVSRAPEHEGDRPAPDDDGAATDQAPAEESVERQEPEPERSGPHSRPDA